MAIHRDEKPGYIAQVNQQTTSDGDYFLSGQQMMSEIAYGRMDPSIGFGKGSVFFNNTSYSGADIKVVINQYKSEKIESRWKEIDREILTLNTELEYAEKRYNEASFAYRTAAERGHVGTPEIENMRKLADILLKQQDQIREQRKTMMQEQEKLGKDKDWAPTKVIAEAQTISISTHRDKQDVRACGTVYPKGFTRGPRSIAGSIIFTVFNKHVLYDFLDAHPSDFDSVAFTSALMDQLPPVDIILAFANEYGSLSRMTIYGAEFVNEGQTMSIEDMLTENVVQWVARDYDPMRDVGSAVKYDTGSGRLQQYGQGLKASELLYEEDYQTFKKAVDPYDRFVKRRNPFL